MTAASMSAVNPGRRSRKGSVGVLGCSRSRKMGPKVLGVVGSFVAAGITVCL